MFRQRIIPVLLLYNKGLVKSVKFKNYRYIGDPINAVKIFNDLKADELMFLDITASWENRTISVDFVKNVGEEANMPFAVGGGINSLEQVHKLISSGAEKVVLNTSCIKYPNLIYESARYFGSQSIVAAVDIKRNKFRKYKIYIYGGTKKVDIDILKHVKTLEELGAGELFINSIDRDGTREGYDLDLISLISQHVNIPVIACGGAGKLSDITEVTLKSNASAAAVGSMFLFHGARNAVLINYPDKKEILETLKLL